MWTRCLGFHESGEGHQERTAEKWGDMAVLNYLDQWKGGWGAHACVFGVHGTVKKGQRLLKTQQKGFNSEFFRTTPLPHRSSTQIRFDRIMLITSNE